MKKKKKKKNAQKKTYQQSSTAFPHVLQYIEMTIGNKSHCLAFGYITIKLLSILDCTRLGFAGLTTEKNILSSTSLILRHRLLPDRLGTRQERHLSIPRLESDRHFPHKHSNPYYE